MKLFVVRPLAEGPAQRGGGLGRRCAFSPWGNRRRRPRHSRRTGRSARFFRDASITAALGRNAPDWPAAGTPAIRPTTCTPAACCLPASRRPAASEPSRFTFDPRNPVPTIGGGISAVDDTMQPGGFDQRGRADFFRLPGYLAAERAARRADLPDSAAGRGAGGHRPYRDAPCGRRRQLWIPISPPSSSTCIPPSTEHPDGLAINITGLHHPGALSETATKNRKLLTPGQACELRLPALSHLQRLQGRAPRPPRRQQQQLAAFRRQPQHRRPLGPGAALPGSPPDHLSRRRAPVARGVAGANVTCLHDLSEIRCRYRIMSSSVMSSGGTSQ